MHGNKETHSSSSCQAYETERGLPVGSPDTETEVEVTITIIDVNDEPPTFNKREYRASVPENVPDGTPLPNLDMFVQDRDVVSSPVNFNFSLFVIIFNDPHIRGKVRM